MRLGALQPGYLPWLGFFDQIARTDVFILYDDLPYSKDTWRNRNRIRTAQGWCWLTVPVINAGLTQKTIREVKISEERFWRRAHWRSIKTHYARSPHFTAHEEFFAKFYERRWHYLVDLNLKVILYLVDVLGIRTKILISSLEGLEVEYLRHREKGKDPTGRVAFLCQLFGADRFLEGALGRTFMDPARLEQLGVTMEFHDYHHPQYHQLFQQYARLSGGFIPYLSLIDLLFNHGPESLDILTGRKTGSLASELGKAMESVP
jgi:WbqC-like protein family